MVDAAVLNNTSSVGLGAIILSKDRRVRAAVCKPLKGSISVIQAETLTLLFGLNWALSCGIQIREVFSDSLSLVTAINKGKVFFNELGVLFEDVIALLSKLPRAVLSHVAPNANSAAHDEHGQVKRTCSSSNQNMHHSTTFSLDATSTNNAITDFDDEDSNEEFQTIQLNDKEEHRTNGLQRITDVHPSFMPMTYPLKHLYGEDEYRLRIPFRGELENESDTKKLTMRQYYCFRLQQRLNEGHTLLQAGRLLQQYIVDCDMAIKEERFRWIRNNQRQLRSELYSGLMDVVHRGDSDCSKVGKAIILPSSHCGGPRYRIQNYQDAMAISKWAGYPYLFLTFTCNPKWPKMNDMLSLISQKDNANRVDVICRVFEIKLFQLMEDLKNQQLFGKIIASNHIDKISAEIPDRNIDPDGYNAINKFMIHGPCGKLNPHSPCTHVEKKGVFLDNRYVVPYNRNLIVKFDAHINVEICNYSRSIKYLFKKPAVERLLFHLPGEHTVIFDETKCVNDVFRQPGIEKTTFTEWLETNKIHEDARELTYVDFPTCWGLLDDDKEWTDCLTEAVIWQLEQN
ncbi:uncharacterized protein LOC133039236 [Cannabis sativa]|uniref:uncharacterized protein LOC133039236 n=1 Tax=Cannabis sativa TaxID=3483 RepID=UPI0029CA6070|nr:uncharacterized protein LOC133039236 [Cannabis sativa]